MAPPIEPWKERAADPVAAAGGVCLGSLAATTPFTTLAADGGGASSFCAGVGAVRTGAGFSTSFFGTATLTSLRSWLLDAIMAGAECRWYCKIPSDAMTAIPAATNPQRRAGQVIQVLRVGRAAVSSASVAGNARASTSRQSPQRA